MMYPLVPELADDGIPVTVTGRVLKLVRQHYYRWLAAPLTAAELEEAYLANALFDTHHDDPEFGYGFLTEEVREGGFRACERTVWKVCSKNGWWSSFGKKKSKKKATVHTPAHDDLVRRQFSADAPNHLWLGDITEHPVAVVARDLGVCWWTVMDAVVLHGTPLVEDPERVKKVRALGIDERPSCLRPESTGPST